MTDRWELRSKQMYENEGKKRAYYKALDKIGPGDVVFFDELRKVTHPARDVLGSPFKHPVDKDLDEINKKLDQYQSWGVSVRAELGAEIVQKIKRIIEGNSLTPTQQIRVKATRYRMFTECMGMSHETAHISAFQLPLPVSTTQHLDFDHTLYIREAPGGPSMSQSQITTTVSMQVRDSQRATLKDLKTLITEVERVGGTDESYVDINRLHSACLDAVVVTAVQVTEPDLDPTVACALTIEDAAVKVNTLIDLTVNGGRTVREQARKALTDLTTAATAKPAKSAKKATAAKPAAKA
jgi:hypothetical protein